MQVENAVRKILLLDFLHTKNSYQLQKNNFVLHFWTGSCDPNYYETITNRQDFSSSTTLVFTKNSDFGGHLVSTYHLCYN